MEQPVGVSFQISVDDLPSLHSAVELAMADLLGMVGEVPGVAVEEESAAITGQKGVVAKWAAKALTPGGENAIVQLFRLWLQRDRRRSVEITIETPGAAEPTVLRVTGEQVSLDVLSEALQAAAKLAKG